MTFTAAKITYCGKRIAAGDEVFDFASETRAERATLRGPSYDG